MASFDLSIFDPKELRLLQKSVKEELFSRVTGKINSGSKNGRSYGIHLMSQSELNSLSVSLAKRLGKAKQQVRRINFNT